MQNTIRLIGIGRADYTSGSEIELLTSYNNVNYQDVFNNLFADYNTFKSDFTEKIFIEDEFYENYDMYFDENKNVKILDVNCNPMYYDDDDDEVIDVEIIYECLYNYYKNRPYKEFFTAVDKEIWVGEYSYVYFSSTEGEKLFERIYN